MPAPNLKVRERARKGKEKEKEKTRSPIMDHLNGQAAVALRPLATSPNFAHTSRRDIAVTLAKTANGVIAMTSLQPPKENEKAKRAKVKVKAKAKAKAKRAKAKAKAKARAKEKARKNALPAPLLPVDVNPLAHPPSNFARNSSKGLAQREVSVQIATITSSPLLKPTCLAANSNYGFANLEANASTRTTMNCAELPPKPKPKLNLKRSTAPLSDPCAFGEDSMATTEPVTSNQTLTTRRKLGLTR